MSMDHFALHHDSLFKAQLSGQLHRNFMGYTTNQTDLLIGLGTSAISDAKYAYAQNLKKVEDYAASILNNRFAVFKGHLQTSRDLLLKKCILELACEGKIRWQNILHLKIEPALPNLGKMMEEGIICYNFDGIQVTDVGRAFIRNICSVFDFRMNEAREEIKTSLFSKAI